MQTDMSVRANYIEQTLTSLDDIRRAKPLPFLYTRIQARLDSKQFSSKQYCFLEKIGFLLSRPIIAISFLLLIFFIDGLVIQSTFTSGPAKSENIDDQLPRTGDDSDETLFYVTPESEWAFIY